MTVDYSVALTLTVRGPAGQKDSVEKVVRSEMHRHGWEVADFMVAERMPVDPTIAPHLAALASADRVLSPRGVPVEVVATRQQWSYAVDRMVGQVKVRFPDLAFGLWMDADGFTVVGS
jgi:hypothetical protein